MVYKQPETTATAATEPVLILTDPPKRTQLSATGCGECLSLVLVLEDNAKDTCVQCEPVNDLLWSQSLRKKWKG